MRKKAKPEDWEKELAKENKNFAEIKRDLERKDSKKLCSSIENGLRIYTGKSIITNNSEKMLSEMPDGQKTDVLKLLNAFDQLCKNFSKSALIELGRLEHDKDSRTCLVYSSADRQTFTWQGENNWVSVQEYYGICRSVIIERFERVKESDLWNFIRRKTITNPSDEFMGKTCRELSDQTEHIFDWRPRDLYLNCDYIEFGL